MTYRFRQSHPARRTPSLGVSGVTLLMLVTLALTTTPALSKGRDVGTLDATRLLAGTERALLTERAVKRLSGQREVPNRQIRPAGSGSFLSIARPVLLPLLALRAAIASETAFAPLSAARVELALLNLPPPLV